MPSYLIKGAQVINEGKIVVNDILIKNGIIERIDKQISVEGSIIEINAQGKYLMPGIIDDQVHFREPGLTEKANIFTESRAAVAGGTTSFMEMPNTKPAALTQELLQDKYDIGANTSLANYSFFMGASNDNLDEVLKTNINNVCGIKAFMGSSTGNMLVDDPGTLEKLFANAPMLIATHCEDEATIRRNTSIYTEKYGEDIPFEAHPDIRSAEGCLISSTLAIGLAKKHNTRLHILHISTADELSLFENTLPLSEKKITSEVCVHHLYFNKDDYRTKGSLIKCNPAIKDIEHQTALFEALLDDRLDIIATDHAPHTWTEKQNKYATAPSGLPLVQHSLYVMLDFYRKGMISLERIIEKMCHAPAQCFQIEKRGYIREGYWADVVLLDMNVNWTVDSSNILYKCGWSPLEGKTFKGKVEKTWVSGHLAYDNGILNDSQLGKRVTFNR